MTDKRSSRLNLTKINMYIQEEINPAPAEAARNIESAAG
jgi:hypothetical protein